MTPEQERRAKAQLEYRELHEAYRATKDRVVFDRALRTWTARWPEFEGGCKSCSDNIQPRRGA